MKKCRFCQGDKLTQVLDLGDMPSAGGFLTAAEFATEKKYPLTLDFCRDCYLVQVPHNVSDQVLFKDNYLFRSSASKTVVAHFEELARELHEAYRVHSVLEIGCNDGVLLKPLAERGVLAVGVDPAVDLNVPNNIKCINAYFNEDVAKEVKSQYGKFDSVVASYSFAHIDDMVSVMNGIKLILKEDGIFIIENYYLGNLVEEMQYDMIYHEHMSYYSLITLMKFLERFGMEVFDIKYDPKFRSGCMKYYVRNVARRDEEVSVDVLDTLKYEFSKGYDTEAIFKGYGLDVSNHRKTLMAMLSRLKHQGKSIVGYGASGRGTIIMNYCGIDSKYLDYVIDDTPYKQGRFTPGTHIPIQALCGSPDYILVFAWAFIDEIKNKLKGYKGKYILPLPHVKVIDGAN